MSCFVMFAAGSRYETPDIGGIAHFAEHMFFKGTERRPTARDISAEIDGIGGEFNAFTGKEYTGYYVKCAAGTRDVALDVLVDMIRNSRFDSEEIEREKGVIVEEMNMYFDTPRDFIGGVYDELALRRPPARPRHHRHQGVRPRRDPGDLHVVHRPLVPARAHGDRHRRPGSATASTERLEELLGSIEPRRDGAARAGCALRRTARPSRCSRSSPTRPTSSSAPAATHGPSRPVRAAAARRPCSAVACRRASSPRCASGAVSPTTSSARTRATLDAGSLYAQAGVDIQRIDDAVTTIAGRAAAHGRRSRCRRRAREGSRVCEGPLRARHREPARDDHVRTAPRGAARPGRGARGDARRASTPSPPRTSSGSRRTSSASS